MQTQIEGIWEALAGLQTQLNALKEIVHAAQLADDLAEPPEPPELSNYKGGELRFWEEVYTATLVAEDPRNAATLADQAVRDRRARLEEEG